MQRPAVPPLNANMPTAKTIMHTVMISEVPITPSFLDLSAKSAIKGCITTARIFAAAIVIPIWELVYPFASMKTEAKLLTTAYTIQYAPKIAPYVLLSIFSI